MINRDYHHHFLDEAISDAEQLISAVRIANMSDQARFITGYGVIREELFVLLKRYDLDPAYEISNPGAIIVTIE